MKLVSKTLSIVNLILIIIAIYYALITEKRTKKHISKLEKDMRDNENTLDVILTDEEFAEVSKRFQKQFRTLFIKPNDILIVLIIAISICSVVVTFIK